MSAASKSVSAIAPATATASDFTDISRIRRSSSNSGNSATAADRHRDDEPSAVSKTGNASTSTTPATSAATATATATATAAATAAATTTKAPSSAVARTPAVREHGWFGSVSYNNPYKEWEQRSFLQGMQWASQRHKEEKANPPPTIPPVKLIPKDFKPGKAYFSRSLPIAHPSLSLLRRPPANASTFTWYGHSSMLLQLSGVTLFTDPILSQSASPLPSVAGAFARRHRDVATVDDTHEQVRQSSDNEEKCRTIVKEQLPPIDFVFVSHNHYDHCDLPTLRALVEKTKNQVYEEDDDNTASSSNSSASSSSSSSSATITSAPQNRSGKRERRRCYFVAPLGLASWLKSELGLDKEQVIELDWWQSHTFTDFRVTTDAGTRVIPTVTLTVVPAQHWSRRGLLDERTTLWGGIVLDVDGHRFYYSGDTGFSEQMYSELGAAIAPVHISAVPIGAYCPQWFLRPQHIHPQEAVQLALRHLSSTHTFGCHWGTFILSQEPYYEPAEWMLKCAKEEGKSGSVYAPIHGFTYTCEYGKPMFDESEPIHEAADEVTASSSSSSSSSASSSTSSSSSSS